MNREEKSATIQEIAAQIEGSEAIFAVDYRGISVSQAAELRSKLREADASFRVVKNRLTKIAADNAGEQRLAELLQGPTALTFVRGDTAQAAKAISTFNKEHGVLTYKGGFMDSTALDAESFKAIALLPNREVLIGQFAGVVASPVTGIVRGLNALLQGLASQLGQIVDQGLVSGEAATPAEPTDEAAPEVDQDTASKSEATSQSDSSEPSEGEPQAEQAEADPAVPGSEAEETGGTDVETSETDNEKEE
jgi:large subunit ribosomal protein L10